MCATSRGGSNCYCLQRAKPRKIVYRKAGELAFFAFSSIKIFELYVYFHIIIIMHVIGVALSEINKAAAMIYVESKRTDRPQWKSEQEKSSFISLAYLCVRVCVGRQEPASERGHSRRARSFLLGTLLLWVVRKLAKQTLFALLDVKSKGRPLNCSSTFCLRFISNRGVRDSEREKIILILLLQVR